MKHAIPLVPVILITLLAGSARTGVVTREEKITGFNQVDISHGFTVSITQGDKFSVVTSVDEELVPYLEVVKKGKNTLKIGLEPGSYRIPAGTMQAEITMPELTGLDMSGGSHTTITGFKSTKALDVDLSGASMLRGDIEAGNASFGLSGGSDVTLTGSARDMRIHGSGGSHFELADFPVTDASVDLSGGSKVTVRPSGRLNVEASGGSRVYYLGSPTVGKIRMSGSSSVERK